MLSGRAAFGWLVGRYARPFALGIGFMMCMTLAANLLAVVQPAILGAMLANLAGTAAAPIPAGTSVFNLNYLGVRVSQWVSLRSGADTDILVLFGLLIVVSAVLVAGLNYLAESAAAWLRAHIGRAIQQDLLTHLLSQDMAFFARQRAGELISRVTADTTNTAQALGPLIRSLLHNLVQIVVYAAYLFNTSLWLSVGALVLLAAQFGLTQLLKKPIRSLVRRDTDTSAGFLGALQEAFTGVRVTKSFGAERFELAKLHAATDRLLQSVWSRGRIEKAEAPARSVLDSLAVLGVFLIAIAQMRAGILTFEGLILFTFVARLLITPINQLATSALWIEATDAASGRIRELLAEQPRLVDGPGLKRTFESALTFDDVSFSYDGRTAIDHLTLEIRKGEFIALVGPSGAGKSTFADLVLRLHDPDSGQVRIDGVDVRSLRQREYRQLFGVVSQENLLFHDTVRNNIRYGRDVSDEAIERAARAAHADRFIATLPQGYDTVVGDRGVRLSGGERQRVAIARALVHNPQILILDEATSALDSESERLVQEAINQVVQSTTAIVIAHRLSTVTHADRIVVLNDGRIEAIGRHEQLLSTSATYQRFCQLQFVRPVDSTVSV
jgi:ABC-type multidrug transport system fused ATPase/permease subunit